MNEPPFGGGASFEARPSLERRPSVEVRAAAAVSGVLATFSRRAALALGRGLGACWGDLAGARSPVH